MTLLDEIKKLDIFHDKRYFLLKESTGISKTMTSVFVFIVFGITVFLKWDEWSYLEILLLWVFINVVVALFNYFNTETLYDVTAFIPEKEKVPWYQKVWSHLGLIIQVIISVYFFRNIYNDWHEFNTYEQLLYVVPVSLTLLFILLPSKQKPDIYIQDQCLKFQRNNSVYFQSISEFEEIRISIEVISMKSKKGKVDQLVGYDLSDSQQEQLKQFFNKHAPHIKIQLID